MSPRFRLCVLHVCVRPLLAHSPWNRVLTLLVNFAHMSLWIPSSVPLPGCTRSLGSSVCISVPSHAQHHVASTVHWHCLCVLSCRYHGCPGQLLPLCLLCVLSLICVNTTIPVSLALSNVCSVQHTRTCSLGWLSVPCLPPGGQGSGAAKPSQCQACG